ncbi:DHA2 family efflux MFS transporter permease subunit [Desulfotomaculum copahuensis]|uniref:MFS transporter n=1 Tax=Desulfotomaculum copahuensis TaxID=1838280 RepID=A0A1B7LFZ6_9FIRM|nr:DHA2 family efflux MFS transporter permease subunit [Desulfotomaculum copahuensis]OAT83638.1 MFS transporter [Desulfotomaculum copahuensis]
MPWASVLMLVLGAFIAILDTSIVNVALPKMMAIFGVGADKIQWVLTGYLLTSGVVVPVTGYLGDRMGFKRVYIIAVAIFTAGSVMCSLAWNENALITARVVQAIGGGAIMPVSMAMTYRIVPREKIGLALGVWGIAISMAPAVGPTLGGYLVDSFNWQMIFTINIPIGIFTVLLSGVFLPSTPLRSDLRFDLPGFILCTGGCFAILLALSEGQDKGWASQYIVTLLTTGVFALILCALWELVCPHPMLDVRLMRNPAFAASIFTTGIITIGLYSAIFLIPIYAQNLLGYTPIQTGFLMMPMALTMGTLMPVSGRLFDRLGAVPLSLAGSLVLIYATYLLHNLSLETSYHQLQLLLVLRATGIGLCMMPLNTAGMNAVPRQLVGRASAMNNLVRQISASLGLAYLTYIMLERRAEHAVRLAGSVTWSSPGAVHFLHRLQAHFSGSLPGEDGRRAVLAVISGLAQRQAMMQGIGDAFLVTAIILAFNLPPLFFLSKRRMEAALQAERKRLAGACTGSEKSMAAGTAADA